MKNLPTEAKPPPFECKNCLTNNTWCPNLGTVREPSGFASEVEELRRITGEKTGQKAVRKALVYFLKEARQRRITKILQTISFKKGFDPLKLRRHER